MSKCLKCILLNMDRESKGVRSCTFCLEKWCYDHHDSPESDQHFSYGMCSKRPPKCDHSTIYKCNCKEEKCS